MTTDANNHETVPSAQEYRADLDAYAGPLDLLLYLIRRDEVDIFDIPVARITEEYLKIVQTIQLLDMNVAGEFLVMAATLMEIKSRMLLPTHEETEGEETPEEDPRNDLIRQLLQYKRFKEAAQKLGDLAQTQLMRSARPSLSLETEPEPVDTLKLLEGIEVWDLLAAFTTLMRQVKTDLPRRILYTDVPMSVYRTEIRTRLAHSGGQLGFLEFFAPGDELIRVIGVFLAMLDLIRQHEIRVRQLGTDFADIVLEFIPPEERPRDEPAAEQPVAQHGDAAHDETATDAEDGDEESLDEDAAEGDRSSLLQGEGGEEGA